MCDYTDLEKRAEYPALSKNIVSDMLKHESAAEEMRVLYVAMTRAKDRLHIFYVNERFHKKQTVSRFVEETGLLDTHSETRREAEKERNQKRGFEWKIKMREPV